MPATRLPTATIALFAVLAACSKSSGGGDPPIAPNAAPTLQLPTQLSGSGGVYSLTLPVGDSVNLVFMATDPDGDPLKWQVVGATQASATVGMTLPTVFTGTTFTLAIAAVTLPATLSLVLIVEDSSGNAEAIDLIIVRTGPPQITGVSPSSAFAGGPQKVTITGSALSLGGTATTRARFNGMLGTSTAIAGETSLSTTTPIGLTAGAVTVGVENTHGSSTLPPTAFTAYAFPPIFATSDNALDGGAGSAAHLARDGAEVHAVWIEGGAIVHRASADAGATWGTAQTLSGAEAPTTPRVFVAGQSVTVAWLGDGTAVHARNSSDGGGSFDPAQILNPAAGTEPARQLHLQGSGDRRYAAWLRGDPVLSAARLVAVASADAGASWTAPALVDDGGAQQAAPAIICEGTTAWVVFTDERQGSGTVGAYTSRSLDGGATWSPARRLSLAGSTVSEPRICADGTDVHAAWLRGGFLRYSGSTNGGAAWSTPVDMQTDVNGAITSPAISCESKRVYAAYVAGGSSVRVSRITATGAAPQHALVSTATVPAGATRIIHRGNYVFAAWRSDTVASGAARIRQSISVDLGQTFNAPTGVGLGPAAQDEPILLVDGAQELFCWLDYRAGPTSPALFTNRSQ